MKKLSVIFLSLLAFSLIVDAQAPNAIPYQGVARTTAGNIIASQNVSLRITIRNGSSNGIVVYKETHVVTTTTLGLFNVNIGTGTVVTGTLATVDWGNGAKFLQVEMDAAGGSSYTDMGTTQLMSVPYALFAGSVATTSHYIGENYGGGIVFYVYDNGKHGLIAATADHNTAIRWYNGTDRYIGTADGIGSGAMNTTMIVSLQTPDNPNGNFAAKVCADYSVTTGGITYDDWYLPSRFELYLLYLKKSYVGGFATNNTYGYWSSTEVRVFDSDIWSLTFDAGDFNGPSKTTQLYVRAIRSF